MCKGGAVRLHEQAVQSTERGGKRIEIEIVAATGGTLQRHELRARLRAPEHQHARQHPRKEPGESPDAERPSHRRPV